MRTPFDAVDGCDVCWLPVDRCLCPTCPTCGITGDPACYRRLGPDGRVVDAHGLELTEAAAIRRAQDDWWYRVEEDALARELLELRAAVRAAVSSHDGALYAPPKP